jgi:hypothetical protein
MVLKGLRVTLSEPIAVAKSKKGEQLGYPRLTRLADGQVLITIWLGGDNYGTIGDGKQGFTWSADGGKTWTEPEFVDKNSCNRSLVLPSGDCLCLPYALYPTLGGMGGPYYLISKGLHQVKWFKDGAEFSGWPRPDKSFDPKKGITGFVCHGSTLTLRDGTQIGTLYGRFQGDGRDSLVLFESRDGLKWKYRSSIWDAKKDEPLPGTREGANESALAFLKDGRLMCVFRGATGHLAQTFSRDEGKTWEKPTLAAVPGDVEPSLAVLKNGMLALASGRYMHLSFNLDGTGKDWQSTSVADHHNMYYPEDDMKGKGIYGWGTSGYPNVIALDDTHLLYTYDRWLAGRSSVWAVRIAVEETKEPLAEVKDLRVENPMLRSPVCWVIDDPGPFSTATADYEAFGKWASANGVKGKFSLVPCLGGAASVDGSAGEFPGHTQQERLEWIETVRKFFTANWSFTPEVATHKQPWDFENRRMLADLPRENEWLDKQPLEVQTRYIANTMVLLKNVGFDLDGLTAPWGGWRNLAKNTSDALYEVFKKDFAVYFAEYGEEPAIAYEDKQTGRTAVSLRPQINEIHRLDIVGERIKAGKCVMPVNHANVLTKDKFSLTRRAVEQLNRDFGDRILWMTGREVGLYYATRARLQWSAGRQDHGVAISLSTPWATPYVTVSFAAAGMKAEELTILCDDKPLSRVSGKGRDFAPGTWFGEGGRVYVCLPELKAATLTIRSPFKRAVSRGTGETPMPRFQRAAKPF